MSTIVFANGKINEKVVIKPSSKKTTESQCCTATLTYNGVYKDHITVCDMITTGDNCKVAAHKLLLKYPDTGLTDPLGR
nr:hypothetical protein [uncultured Flavobacterium sp.]